MVGEMKFLFLFVMDGVERFLLTPQWRFRLLFSCPWVGCPIFVVAFERWFYLCYLSTSFFFLRMEHDGTKKTHSHLQTGNMAMS